MKRRDFLKVVGAAVAIAPFINYSDEETNIHPYAVSGGVVYAYNPDTQEYYDSGNAPWTEHWVEGGTLHHRDKRTGKSWNIGLKAVEIRDGWLL